MVVGVFAFAVPLNPNRAPFPMSFNIKDIESLQYNKRTNMG